MRIVPVADEKFVRIEAAFLPKKFGKLRIAREDLVSRRPFVIGEIVAAAIIDRDLDE